MLSLFQPISLSISLLLEVLERQKISWKHEQAWIDWIQEFLGSTKSKLRKLQFELERIPLLLIINNGSTTALYPQAQNLIKKHNTKLPFKQAKQKREQKTLSVATNCSSV